MLDMKLKLLKNIKIKFFIKLIKNYFHFNIIDCKQKKVYGSVFSSDACKIVKVENKRQVEMLLLGSHFMFTIEQ